MSKNIGVVEAFKKALGCDIIVDENGHLMGASVLRFWPERAIRRKSLISPLKIWYLRQERSTADAARTIVRIICVYRDDMLIDSWGNRCDKGALKAGTVLASNR